MRRPGVSPGPAGRKKSLFLPGIFLAAALSPATGWGCAACYGQSDSPLAAGMNWGILSLLGFIVFVLGGVACFFFFLARRSAALRAGIPAKEGLHELGLLEAAHEDLGIGRRGERPRNAARPHRHRRFLWAMAPLRRKHAAIPPGRLSAPR